MVFNGIRPALHIWFNLDASYWIHCRSHASPSRSCDRGLRGLASPSTICSVGRLFFLVSQPLFFDVLECAFVSGDFEPASLGGEFGFLLGNVAGEFGIAVERVDLIGILFEIEVFSLVKRVEINQFATSVRDAVVAGNAVSTAFVVVIVEAVSPVAGRIAFEHGHEGRALHVAWDSDARDFEKGFGEVEIGYDVVVNCAGLDVTGPTYQKRRAQALLVHPTFVEPAAFAEIEGLVGGVDDDRIFRKSVCFEVVEHLTDGVVY